MKRLAQIKSKRKAKNNYYEKNDVEKTSGTQLEDFLD